MTTSTYEVYGAVPTMEKEKLDALLKPYELPEAGEEKLGGVHQAANVEASTATTIAGLKDDLNALLTALKTAGIMAADAEEEAGT